MKNTNDLNNMLLATSVLMLQSGDGSLGDYLIRAIIGGAVWLLFRLLCDHLSACFNAKKQKRQPLKTQSHEDNTL